MSEPAKVEVRRCKRTGNPVGTDTRPVGKPCPCENCTPEGEKMPQDASKHEAIRKACADDTRETLIETILKWHDSWYEQERTILDLRSQLRALTASAPVAQRREFLDEAIRICEEEEVDAEGTGTESDMAYNAACSHIAQRFLALRDAAPLASQHQAAPADCDHQKGGCNDCRMAQAAVPAPEPAQAPNPGEDIKS